MDELRLQILSILGRFELPIDGQSVERVLEDVEIAQAAKFETASLKLPKKDAINLLNAVKLIVRTSREFGLATDEQLELIQRLGRKARVRLAITTRPINTQWLGPCAANFQNVWKALTERPPGLHYADDASPALQFVTACCKLVDENVNASAVLRAFKEFSKTVEMSHEEYAEFCQSNLWRELTRSAL